MWIGAGVIGGIGLGLGYISPVSTLIKWFPDRRGMATGMAIMGFGGGAMIGSPLATILMNGFKGGAYSVGGYTLPWAGFRTATDVGVWQTFVALAGDLLRIHDGRRVRLSPAAGRLEAARLDATG